MKILFAGASGVIGRLLVPLLLSEGHEIVAVSRAGATRSMDEGAAGLRWRGLDVFDREAVFAVLAEERPECVMHQLTDLRARDFAANSRIRIMGTRNLVDAAKAAGVQRMVAQSIAWIYEPGNAPATESTRLDMDAAPPRGRMIQAVAALESATKEIAEHVILRYGLFYGPGTRYDREGSFANQVRAGEVEATSTITNFVHVEDAARAALQALDWPAGAVNVVDGDAAEETEWLPMYAEWLGNPVPRTALTPAPVPLRPVLNEYALSLSWSPRHRSWREEFRRG